MSETKKAATILETIYAQRAKDVELAIAMSTNAPEQALKYALAGASVISVLTEPTWFKGNLLDMRLVREAVNATANTTGSKISLGLADRPAILPQERLKALYDHAHSLGMEPLVEVNNADEMTRALELGARVIGVNNRNLHDFQVDMGTTSRLVEMVKERDVVLCALSGISGPEDVRVYKEQGVRAVLVGEALMRSKDTVAFIKELLGWPDV